MTRRLAAEFLGTALLLATVVGSGIMAERLAGGNQAVALLCNTLATGFGLAALILAFGPVSGAHFNPVVSGVRLRVSESAAFAAIQVVGAVAGVFAAHAMFGEAVLQVSTKIRSGWSQAFSEFVATFGLVGVIELCARRRPDACAFAVGAYIAAAYWFTASTSFANPAVTVARSLTNTFAGIRPADAPMSIGAQIAGGMAAAGVFRWMAKEPE